LEHAQWSHHPHQSTALQAQVPRWLPASQPARRVRHHLSLEYLARTANRKPALERIAVDLANLRWSRYCALATRPTRRSSRRAALAARQVHARALGAATRFQTMSESHFHTRAVWLQAGPTG